ncbi:MAG: hypothetical protein JO309_06160 [Pseudonocardiales bacterium]|nr:hypothetical protein [Pseudonocardiales bacterium]MBV9728981.1 hypothetical protein [Pseudonocardiales bacterium]
MTRRPRPTVTVRSAGSATAETINPTAVEVVRELGIDIAQESPAAD